MYLKVLLIASFAAVASAQLSAYANGNVHGHDHGRAVSSQNIVLHQTHGPSQNAYHANGNVHGHDHGHAVSSQNIVLQQTHGPSQNAYHQSAHNSHHEEEHYGPAHYTFEYNVNDPHTGDIKSQHETREGDVVRGFYSLVEPDGTIRRVEYTADKHNGFNAIVHREGHSAHPKSHEPIVYHH